jgi:hypothetical protein
MTSIVPYWIYLAISLILYVPVVLILTALVIPRFLNVLHLRRIHPDLKLYPSLGALLSVIIGVFLLSMFIHYTLPNLSPNEWLALFFTPVFLLMGVTFLLYAFIRVHAKAAEDFLRSHTTSE